MNIIKETTMKKGLPKTIQSICPECKKLIKAKIYDDKGKVVIEKECKEHGKYKDVVWNHADMYLRAEKFAVDGLGVENPLIKNAKVCPDECGLCNLHLSHSALTNIDLTNRCNLKCPICFANANVQGYIYEPSFDEIVKMLKTVRANRPVPCPAVQFSGGEPTIYPKFLEVIAKARELGFSQIQIATNGIMLAEEDGFAQKCSDAGLHTVYLQFDGITENVYRQARGRELLEIKKKAIENCRKVKPLPLSVVLVPTVVNTINDDQLGNIVRFAIENIDVVRSVNFQPVAFIGRISQEEREKCRFTLSDLADRLEKQTNFVKKDDFFPVPCVTAFSDLATTITGEPKVAFTTHPHCGIATYLFIENGNITPVTRFVDIEGLLAEMRNLSEKAKGGGYQFLFKLLKISGKLMSEETKRKSLEKQFEKYFGKYIDKKKAPKGLDIPKYVSGIITHGDKESIREIAWKTLMIGGMHFQDNYNYDIERLKRCVIHYSVPDGRIIPFCAYNSGPYYREQVEKKFSIPFKEWKEKNKIEGRCR